MATTIEEPEVPDAPIRTSASRLSLSRFEAHLNLGVRIDRVTALERGPPAAVRAALDQVRELAVA